MNISQLMDELTSRWPHQFAKPEALAAWTRSYERVLLRFSGAALSAAWGTIEREWTGRSAPQPADILKHCREPVRAGAGGDDWGAMKPYEPIPRADLPNVPLAKLESELQEAKFNAVQYGMLPDNWTYRQDGTRNRNFGDLARQWRDRVAFIEQLLHGPTQRMAAE